MTGGPSRAVDLAHDRRSRSIDARRTAARLTRRSRIRGPVADRARDPLDEPRARAALPLSRAWSFPAPDVASRTDVNMMSRVHGGTFLA